MTTETTQREVTRSPQVAAQIASFRRDPPLHESFPLKLSNGATVPEFTAKCAHCGQPVTAGMVHGRILDSLPTVKTLDANAFCEPCQRLIPINGRFREVGSSFQFEFRDTKGHWYAVTKPTAASNPLKALASKLGSLLRVGR